MLYTDYYTEKTMFFSGISEVQLVPCLAVGSNQSSNWRTGYPLQDIHRLTNIMYDTGTMERVLIRRLGENNFCFSLISRELHVQLVVF